MAITLRQTKGSALTYAELDANFTTITGGTLAQFATTTSAQLAGVISDETGTGPLVFGTSPTLTSATLTSPTVTGGSINNTPIGATTPSTGAFTTLSASGNVTLSGGTANGVPYLNGSKVLTSGSALVFDGVNLGLGVTPSAWNSAFKGLQIGVSSALAYYGSNFTLLGNNWYSNSSGVDTYTTTGYATLYQQDNIGQHKWFSASSGTAGAAITFTQAMALDASSNLSVTATVKTGGYTVATLPAGSIGQRAYVTDAVAPTYLGALTGGGAVTCPVFYNGTAWVSA